MSAPTTTPQQREEALARAAQARRERRAMLDGLADPTLSVAAVLTRTDDVARKTRVAQVVRALPGYGPVRTRRVMGAVGIDSRRRVGGLGTRQTRELLTAVSSDVVVVDSKNPRDWATV